MSIQARPVCDGCGKVIDENPDDVDTFNTTLRWPNGVQLKKRLHFHEDCEPEPLKQMQRELREKENIV